MINHAKPRRQSRGGMAASLRRLLGGLALGGLAWTGAAASMAQESGVQAHATLHDRSGAVVGEVDFTEASAGLLIQARLVGLPAGVHGFHLHAVGRCEGDFSSAGGHFNPMGSEHGYFSAEGPHAGDMPNIHVPAGGSLTVEVFLPEQLLIGQDGLLDDDGTALVIHEGPDDYHSQPSGAAGARIACGVIKEKE